MLNVGESREMISGSPSVSFGRRSRGARSFPRSAANQRNGKTPGIVKMKELADRKGKMPRKRANKKEGVLRDSKPE